MPEAGSHTVEDALAERLARFGAIAAIGGLIVLVAVVFGNALIRALDVAVNAVLLLIVNQGPAVAAFLGGISTIATYYGWLRIARRREKLNAREEAKGQAIDQAGNAVQRLPGRMGCLSGCSARLSLGVLGIALVFCLLTYAPHPLHIFGANMPSSSSSPNRGIVTPSATPGPIVHPTSTPARRPTPANTPPPASTATPQPTATRTPTPGNLVVLSPVPPAPIAFGNYCRQSFTGSQFSFTNTGGVMISWAVVLPTYFQLESGYPLTGTLQPLQGDSQTEIFDGIQEQATITIQWGNRPTPS